MSWIKMSDRWPETKEKVLIFYEDTSDSNIVDTAVFIDKDKYLHPYFQLTRPDEYNGWCVNIDYILFWQPFPDLSKDNE